jgi:hypothetical protein
MKQQSIVFAVVLLAGCAFPQQQRQATIPGMGGDYQAMMQEMQAAEAGASRPGDEKLTCEALQEQLVSVVQDPEFQADMQAAGAAAEKDLQQTQVSDGEIAAKSAATLIASIVPGAAMGHMVASAADNEARAAAGAARMESMNAARQQMMGHMAEIMRGQRLIELAQAKKCDWAADIDTGAAPAQNQ